MNRQTLSLVFYVLVLFLVVFAQAYPGASKPAAKNNGHSSTPRSKRAESTTNSLNHAQKGTPTGTYTPIFKRQSPAEAKVGNEREHRPLANIHEDAGDSKSNVHKRNLVAASQHARAQQPLENINEDAGEPKSNVRKRNLVGASEQAREHQPLLANINEDAGEPKSNVHKRNLVGASEQARAHQPLANINEDAGNSKSNVHKRNLVGASEQARAHQPLTSVNEDAGEPKSNMRKRNLVGASEHGREEQPLPNINEDAGERHQNIRQRNLIAISKNARENDNSQLSSIAEDAGESKSNVRKRNLVGASEQARVQENQVNINADTGESKSNLHKRNLVGASAQVRKQQFLANVNEDARESHQNIRKRNLIAISKNARENDNSQLSSIDEDTGTSKQNVRKRNLIALAKNLREAPYTDKQEQLINFDLGADSGETKQNIRRRANLIGMAKTARERPASSNSGMYEDADVDDDDVESIQRTRARSLDYEIGHHSAGRSGYKRDSEQNGGLNQQTNGNKPALQALATEIIKDDNPLVGQHNKGSVSNENSVDSGYSLAKEEHPGREMAQAAENIAKEQSFTLFTIANTDVGIEYEKVPYRERYLWDKRDAPCHSFQLKIPDEMDEKSLIKLCIFRPDLEFPDETKMFILNSGTDEENASHQQKVFGYVMNAAVSSVYGRIINRFLYGEISLFIESTKTTTIYVVEEINLLNRLMRNNQKTLKHMLMVMHGRGKDKENMKTVYNAVVTKGASLIDFMVFTNPTDINRNPFIMFSTNHNSYICPGEPVMRVDENGQISLESGANKISVENDGSVRMITKDSKVYTFRPHGRTIIKEGMEVRTLQEHEGSVAITAYTSTTSYDCVLPTPAFQLNRKGGYVCKVCVAMDDLFTKYYLEHHTQDKETASNYLGHIIDRVSWILRSIDLDDDKDPDNIGLDYDAQSLRWTYPDNANEDLNEQDIEILFQSLGGYDFADCCLGIGYTMKNFPNSGFARRPSQTDNVASLTGVCAGKTGRIPNNLIIISANDKKGKFGAISEKQLVYLTASQIAGAFGASPDGAGEDVCDQFIDDHKQPRHHLMWPDVLRNTTLKEQSLSSCSKKEIVKTLSTCKSACFDVDRHPFCGNGIVEEGEECDCGSEYNCKLQTCCYSRIGKHPCRKSGVGCKSESSSTSLLLNKTLLLVTFALLTMSTLKNIHAH